MVGQFDKLFGLRVKNWVHMQESRQTRRRLATGYFFCLSLCIWQWTLVFGKGMFLIYIFFTMSVPKGFPLFNLAMRIAFGTLRSKIYLNKLWDICWNRVFRNISISRQPYWRLWWFVNILRQRRSLSGGRYSASSQLYPTLPGPSV